MPDWVFNTDTMTFSAKDLDEQKKNRPAIELSFVDVKDTRAKEGYWRIFRKYHYLNHSFQKGARVFVTYANGQICGFVSYIYFMHPRGNEKLWQAHRVVVLPDYQGIGIGGAQMNYTAEILAKEGKTAIITSSNMSMVMSLRKDEKWKCTHFGRHRTKSMTGERHNIADKNGSSCKRITASFKYNRF